MKQAQSQGTDKASGETARTLDATVLQVLPRLRSGGVERGTVDVAAAIVNAGGRALVASGGGRLVAELEAAGAEHITLPLYRKAPWAIAANARRIAEILHREKVDLVHARSRAPAWAAWLAIRGGGTPFVTTFHGAYNFSLAIKKRYNAIMARGRPVIAISAFIARHVADNYGIASGDIRLIPRGIDLDRFAPDAVAPERIAKLRAAWDVPEGLPVLMLPGRFTRIKGQALFLEALAGISHRDWTALLVGDDQDRPGYGDELRRKAASLGIADRVRFTGQCDDMPAAHALADVVVSASTQPEAFGRVAVEAQAMGTPVIASAHGGSVETVRNGETGWLTEPRDAGALAKALSAALQMPAQERAAIGRAGIAHVRAHFSKTTMLERTLAVYREAIAAAAR